MQHLTLYELNKTIQQALDSTLDPSYWVIAEIGELRVAQNGHCYLELVEKNEQRVMAKLRATMWANTYRNLSLWFERMTGQSLRQGMNILCNLKVQFHELYGLSANIRDIDANFTLGERARRRQEIIDRLVAEGVYEMNKSLLLAEVPQRLAVITSPTAAGYGDFMDQLEGNTYGYSFDIKLYKATMQGDGAAESIINSLHHIHTTMEAYDAVIIIRGGGSQLDLDCFDDYELATHLAQFPLPVITGIGHERDETIIDMVAHQAQKTPTAVAEFIVGRAAAFEQIISEYYSRLYYSAYDKLKLESQTLNNLAFRLGASAKQSISRHRHKNELMIQTLRTTARGCVSRCITTLDRYENTLQLLDPQRILRRGYSWSAIDGAIPTPDNAKEGAEMLTITHDLRIKSIIKVTED